MRDGGSFKPISKAGEKVVKETEVVMVQAMRSPNGATHFSRNRITLSGINVTQVLALIYSVLVENFGVICVQGGVICILVLSPTCTVSLTTLEKIRLAIIPKNYAFIQENHLREQVLVGVLSGVKAFGARCKTTAINSQKVVHLSCVLVLLKQVEQVEILRELAPLHVKEVQDGQRCEQD